jgi:hypothetical protein
MAERKSFPLRIDTTVHAAMAKWAADDMRSANAQIEFVLREALRRAGRLRPPATETGEETGEQAESDP